MFSSRKKIFAGKRNLQPEPFCPLISDSNGYASLRRPSMPLPPRSVPRKGKSYR